MSSRIVLSDWTLTGYWPYAPVLGNSVETGIPLRGVTHPIPAFVPGSVYRSLLNAGLIENPYYGEGSLRCEWVANRWWMYETYFSIPDISKNLRLVIDGIDYRARIYLNGKEIGRHENMFVPFTYSVGGLCKEKENRLTILLECTPSDSAQFGYTSQTFTQRCRFDYKWDFCTRLVGAGIYGGVWLEEDTGISVDAALIKPRRLDESRWLLPGELDLVSDSACRVSVSVSLSYEGNAVARTEAPFDLQPGVNRIKIPMEIKNPLLWWTNGAGNQLLYSYALEICEDERLLTHWEHLVGFRTFKYRQADGSSGDSLPYLLEVNGKRVYLKGVNVVPYDLMEKYATPEQCRAMISQMRDANINLVRVWGGGVIETPEFYDLCDRYGIAVWQEFIQSSSGCDNVPSKRPEFLAKLEESSRYAVKSRRNHVCLAFWSGGNELCDERFVNQDDRNDHPATFEDANIALLKRLVDELDPDTLMLPTSASGPISFLDPNRPGENHDVHGPWMYCGPVFHYTFYNRSDSILHSEFGCNGLSSVLTLETILPPENRRVYSAHQNMVWEHLGGAWWDSLERDELVFGAFQPEELEAFVACSQFLQAEGIRYAVEANMRRAWQNCGSIIWQYNEPWPNVACTTLVEYGGKKKLAWYFLRDAYRPSYASLRYDQLSWHAGEMMKAGCYIYHEGQEGPASVLVECLDDQGRQFYSVALETRMPENGVCEAGAFSVQVPAGEGFTVRLRLEGAGEPVVSEYLFLIINEATGACSKQFIMRRMQEWLSRE